MQIYLNKIILNNFQGVRDFTFEPNGKSATIRGRNGVGKTTCFSAFTYLLFGKDFQGKADFAIKTLDTNGRELHNLCHSVEAVLDIDGQPITLKKSLKEKYTKKRGSAQADFTGHTTDYFIDAVPVQKKEWDKRIAEIIDEETFKLLTSPAYFNNLHWQKRREILLQVCGNISDQDVISSDKSLAALPDILRCHSMDDQKKIVAGKKKEINDRLKEIPARIDELSKGIVDTSSYNIPAIQTEIERLEAEIQSMKDDKSLAGLRSQRAELQAKLAEAKLARDTAKREAVKKVNQEIEDTERLISKTHREIKDTSVELTHISETINRHEKEMARLRDQFARISAEQFHKELSDSDSVCPACGQSLPTARIEEAKRKLEEAERHFNKNKADKLAEINSQGKLLKDTNGKLFEDKKDLSANKNALEKSLDPLYEKITSLNEEQGMTESRAGLNEQNEIERLEAEIKRVNEQIAANVPPDTSELEGKLNSEKSKLYQIESETKTRKRISSLMDEEKALAGEYEALERQSWLMEQFIVRKVGMLEHKINSRFALARFKLFARNINGGIEECCVTLYNGVPWGSGLNTGAEINVGLDIVKTLSEYYEVTAPIWIDHSESITDFIVPLDGMQTIKLVADARHPELEVIYE